MKLNLYIYCQTRQSLLENRTLFSSLKSFNNIGRFISKLPLIRMVILQMHLIAVFIGLCLYVLQQQVDA